MDAEKIKPGTYYDCATCAYKKALYLSRGQWIKHLQDKHQFIVPETQKFPARVIMHGDGDENIVWIYQGEFKKIHFTVMVVHRRTDTVSASSPPGSQN